jgi:hypothetical protein
MNKPANTRQLKETPERSADGPHLIGQLTLVLPSSKTEAIARGNHPNTIPSFPEILPDAIIKGNLVARE